MFDAAFGNAGGQGGVGALGYADDETLAYAMKKLSPKGRDAYAAVTPKDRMSAALPAARWGTWATVYGGNSRVSGDAGAGTNTTRSNVWGVVGGADYRFSPDTRVGFAVGGGSTNYGIDNGFGGGKSDMFQFGVYGRHTWGASYIAGALSYAWQDNTSDRVVTIAGTDNLHAAFKSNAFSGRIETGWRYATPVVGITPYSALQSTTFFLPSYGEVATSGSNQFALNYASHSVTATRGELGFRWDKALVVQDGMFTLMARTAWAHDWNTDRNATATFQALGTAFTVNGAAPAANAALVSLGGEWKCANGWAVLASYEGEYSRTTMSNGGKGTLRYQW